LTFDPPDLAVGSPLFSAPSIAFCRAGDGFCLIAGSRELRPDLGPDLSAGRSLLRMLPRPSDGSAGWPCCPFPTGAWLPCPFPVARFRRDFRRWRGPAVQAYVHSVGRASTFSIVCPSRCSLCSTPASNDFPLPMFYICSSLIRPLRIL
jgi:hypothetical protein